MDYDPHKSSDASALECWRQLACGVASANTPADIRHALDRLLAMEWVEGPDSAKLVAKLGLDVKAGSLLDIVCDNTGMAIIELSHAQAMLTSLLDCGADPLQGLASDRKLSSLGRLLDATLKTEHKQGDLTQIVERLIIAGDDPAPYLDFFRIDMDSSGPDVFSEESNGKARELLRKALSICGQRTMGAFLVERMRIQEEAGELAKQTPAVQSPTPPRRM